MEIVERFLVLLYDRASSKNRVNEACQQLFAQKGRGLDAYLQPKWHYCNTQRELRIRQAIAGDKHVSLIHSYLVHATGDGRLVQLVGNHFGQHFHMLQPVAESLSSVVVRRDVVEAAHAVKLP